MSQILRCSLIILSLIISFHSVSSGLADTFKGVFNRAGVTDNNFGATNLPTQISAVLTTKKVSGGIQVSGFSDPVIGTRVFSLPKTEKQTYSGSGSLAVSGIPSGCSGTFHSLAIVKGARLNMNFTETIDCPAQGRSLSYIYNGSFKKKNKKKKGKKKKK